MTPRTDFLPRTLPLRVSAVMRGAVAAGILAALPGLYTATTAAASVVTPSDDAGAPLVIAGASQRQLPGDDREALRRFLETTIAVSTSFDDRYAAEVWLVDMQARLGPFVPDTQRRLELLRQIHTAATRAELPPGLVLAVIEVESRFDRFAVSRVGAQGLMQVMPFWKDEIGRPEDNLTRNATNLDYGCRILQYYLEREDGALHRALAAYNGSSGSRRYSDRVEAAWRARWRTAPLDWSH